jgi:uncharacterized membrane protein (DUF2068 family)
VKQKHIRGLLWISIFKTCKGLLFFVLGLGVLTLLHKDVQEWLENLVDALHLNSGNRYIAALLFKAGSVNDHKIAQLSGLTFFYAALFLTEGTGLWFQKRWAEWLTVIVTGSLIPIEVYEVWKQCGVAKLIVLGINIAVVLYLVTVLRRKSPNDAKG